MKILLDECLPKKMKTHLKQFEVTAVSDMGWSSLRNGELLKKAIENGFDIFITIDKNLKSCDISTVVFDVVKNKIEFIRTISV